MSNRAHGPGSHSSSERKQFKLVWRGLERTRDLSSRLPRRMSRLNYKDKLGTVTDKCSQVGPREHHFGEQQMEKPKCIP